MGILGWIVFGLITGFIANKIVNGQSDGCFLNIALGIVGAVMGGALFQFLGEPVFFHFSIWSMFVAVLGAVIVLYLWHAVTGKKTLS
jgi:uncharacterized membrane protein YeaQ/YmgE (transglycosylase-associated protein family)